jgi:hypothetical protein
MAPFKLFGRMESHLARSFRPTWSSWFRTVDTPSGVLLDVFRGRTPALPRYAVAPSLGVSPEPTVPSIGAEPRQRCTFTLGNSSAEGGQIVKRGRLASALTRVALIGAMVGTWAIATSPAHAQEGTDGLIRVVHGLRGLVADVYLDGTLVLPTFQPERSTDPLPVPGGRSSHRHPGSGSGHFLDALADTEVTVPAGFRGSLVAHLDASGKPTLSVFADDVTLVPAGRSRLVVRHAAANCRCRRARRRSEHLLQRRAGARRQRACAGGSTRDRSRRAHHGSRPSPAAERGIPRRHGQSSCI